MVLPFRTLTRAAAGVVAAGVVLFLLGLVAWAGSAHAESLPAPAGLISPPNDPGGTTPVDAPSFAWSAVPGAAGYELQTSEDDRFVAAKSVVTAVPHYTPTDSLKQDQYFWRVRARKSDGTTSAWTAPFGFRREWIQASPPGDADGEGLQLAARPRVMLADAAPGTVGVQLPADQLTVRWSPVRGASYYVVDISTDPNFAAASSSASAVRRSCRTAHTTWTPFGGAVYTGTKRAMFAPCDLADPVDPFLQTGATYFVRVRAVDETPDETVVTSLWSNAARPGPAASSAIPSSFTVVPSVQTPSPAGTAALPLGDPFPAGAFADAPMLAWRPVTGAQAYLVGLARDSSFNTSLLDADVDDLRTENYWATTNTELITNQTLLDNTVTSGYFWFALPCSVYKAPGDPANVCAGSAQAINTPGHFASFTKRSPAITGLQRVVDAANTVTFLWADQGIASPAGGGMLYYDLEVRDAAGAVVEAVKTDNPVYVPPAGAYPDGTYSWRVRMVDASGTSQGWTAGESFTTLTPAAPAPAPAPGLGEPGAPATTGAPAGARTASTTATLKGTQAIASGYPADIAGTVTSASGAPLSGATVVIQVLAAGATAWRKVATEKTASTGAFAAVVTPGRNSRYRAVFAGTATDPAVTSPSIKVSVVPVISLKASARRVVLGGTLTFTGVLKPRSAAATVMLQCRRGTRWLEAGSAKVLSNGAYRVRLKVTSSKAGRCRTAVAASSRYASGRSREAAYSMR